MGPLSGPSTICCETYSAMVLILVHPPTSSECAALALTWGMLIGVRFFILYKDTVKCGITLYFNLKYILIFFLYLYNCFLVAFDAPTSPKHSQTNPTTFIFPTRNVYTFNIYPIFVARPCSHVFDLAEYNSYTIQDPSKVACHTWVI